ncbi:MAG: flagellar protein FlaG [Planctomycetota bacterium]
MIDSTSLQGANSLGDPRLTRATAEAQQQKQQESRQAPEVTASRASAPLNKEELQALVQELNLKVPSSHDLRFQVSGDSHELVVQVIDQQSDEVVREIPPDHLNGLRKHFEELTGTLLDDYA